MDNAQLTTVLAMIIGNATLILPLWLWNRSESRADMREVHSILRAIQDEMKDFHNRLCKIEAERK